MLGLAGIAPLLTSHIHFLPRITINECSSLKYTDCKNCSLRTRQNICGNQMTTISCNWHVTWPFALCNIIVCGLLFLPYMLLQPSLPRLSAFINSCCGIRLHWVTPRFTAVPEVPAGRPSSRSSRVLLMTVFPMFVFSCFSVCSAVVIPVPPLHQTAQLGHFHTYTPTGKCTVHYTHILTSK